MYKFTHVDAFYQVARYIKNIRKNPDYTERYRGPISFRGTVKLHGTNSGVVHSDDDSLVAQSRSRIITPEEDNAGFAKFVDEQKDKILEIMHRLREEHDISSSKKLVLYGEWIGPGIQKGVAINNFPAKMWVIFSAKTIDEKDHQKYVDILPDFDAQASSEGIYNVFDAGHWDLTVDFDDEKSREDAVAKFEQWTSDVEKECPWAKKFGISGLGEGIVWQPIGKFWGDSDLFFKTKGDKHKETKSKNKKEQMDPEVLNSINEFIDFALTENRLNHGIEAIKEAGHQFESKSIGHFLKWIGNDVQRECRLELEDNKLEWKMVAKALNERARNFFITKLKDF